MSRHAAFRAALLDPTADVPGGLTDGNGKRTIKRFGVYRNNVTVALVEALKASFPVLRKLLGDANFDQLAPLFARAYPPTSPLMMHYGAQMPEFLESQQQLGHLPYLSDVARLELALRRSYHAADTPVLSPERLTEYPPDALMNCRLVMAPSIQLVPSKWQLFDIWQYNVVAGAPKPGRSAQSVLITRREFDPQPHAISAAEAAWIAACLANATLANAQDAAAAVDPKFDLTRLLGLLFNENGLTNLERPKDPYV